LAGPARDDEQWLARLARIDGGEYGVCADCGQEIDPRFRHECPAHYVDFSTKLASEEAEGEKKR
jgi:RNA polymerase-binding transcription factor DksA